MHLASPSDSVFVAGHRGLVGQALLRRLRAAGCERLLLRTRAELDLRDGAAVDAFFAAERPAFVVLAAARAGGLGAHAAGPADMLADNLAIELNVVRAAQRHGVRRLVFVGSACVYPREAPQPLREESVLTGPFEPTVADYALAKAAGLKLCQAMRRQHGADFVTVLPTNLYGPGDRFTGPGTHVLPALMHRLHEARRPPGRPDAPVVVWGTGTPRREFLYVDDLADACLHLLEAPEADVWAAAPDGVFNVGSGHELTIAALVDVLRTVTNNRSPVEFDAGKPDGAPRKRLDAGRLRRLGWTAATPLAEGLARTYAWYREHVARPAGPVHDKAV